MKKFLIFAFLGAMVTFGASADFVAGFDNECWLEKTGTKEYWYCGDQRRSCHNDPRNWTQPEHWLTHGEKFTHNGRTFWCCGGTTSKQGTFVEQKEWTTTEYKKKQLSGGTCTYAVTTDACENITEGDCSEPDECMDGYIKRPSGKCVPVCGEGMTFENNTSDKCVVAETTATSGVKTDETTGVTYQVKCGEGFMWDSSEEKCVDKKDTRHVKQISANTMEKCYACTSNEYFRACLDCVSNNSCTDSKMKKACLLK